jgi:hypothetical protein
VDNSFATITQNWVNNINKNIETLSFLMDGHSYQTYIFLFLLGKINLFVGIFFGIHCTSENANVLLQLNVCDRIKDVFCEFKVDDAFGIMYFQFWMQPNTTFIFIAY